MRILIVDDDDDALRIMSASLQSLGFTTYEARNGVTGLRQAQRRKPDLIVLDVSLPDYNQHYIGPGGDAATANYSGGIANWNWWGGSLNVLLTPKCWLYDSPLCLTNPVAARWTGSNYQADCHYP